ncbi:MAG: hypothetical protein KF773_33685 [Deltaproteobacteria bacterium]|nr:hypothetical protein [Deltaproteobacteria bacterium]
MPKVLAIVALAWLSAARVAAADGDPPAPSSAQPEVGRLITAPTAWLPRAGVVVGSAALDLTAVTRDSRFDADLLLSFGLGTIAAVDVGLDKDVRECGACDGRPAPLWMARVAFRMGAPQDALFPGMPAVAFGVRTTVAAAGDTERARAATAFLVASRVIGPIKLHAGAAADDASIGRAYEMGRVVHPFAGFEWTPAQYPKTTLMADFMYAPLFAGDAARTEWIAGWGVRYQALAWGTIDLAVRHRQDESASDSTVLVRVTGTFNAPSPSPSRR